ncbi:MAG: hypothetical protein ABSG67_15815 [Thermoguttaceae bacterium]|jgi:hypothetical protein
MNTHTDPKLLDVAGAVESLPALTLGNYGQSAVNVLSATGTDDSSPLPLAATLAPTAADSRILQSIVDKIASESQKSGRAGRSA